ncbi:MAG: hypothetical protein K2N64_05135 [Anaeroplasmataceae bacterium]|nr:hypothetical protein [Anaeroplasmataceae bacterium]
MIPYVFCVEWLIDMPWWLDTLVGLIITIFGLYIAMWLQKYSDGKKELNDGVFCIESIVKEINNINEALGRSNIDACEPNKNRIETPIWDGILRGSLGQSLARLDKYLQKKKRLKKHAIVFLWYNKIFDFYNNINEFNKWGEMYTNIYLSQLVSFQTGSLSILKTDTEIKSQLSSIAQYCNVILNRVKLDKNELEKFLKQLLELMEVKHARKGKEENNE